MPLNTLNTHTMQRPEISVVTPVYKSEKSIEEFATRVINSISSITEELRTLLGYTFSTPTSVQEFRDFRLKKIKQ
jgi:hypothetical protein